MQYYSFQIHLHFWLAEIPLVILHNQLPLTKFADIQLLSCFDRSGEKGGNVHWIREEEKAEVLPRYIGRTAKYHSRDVNCYFEEYQLDPLWFLFILNCRVIKTEIYIDRGKHVLKLIRKIFLRIILKKLLYSAFVWYEELRRSRRVLSASAVDILLNLRNSSNHSKAECNNWQVFTSSSICIRLSGGSTQYICRDTDRP